ncbi:carnitine/acylcarnitine carrier protein [Thecamonas trahens ATCC 50062]|uniref:Carnitine/acylcarnitine carrier protein n=1 Tax=Thecamonas trahens ATCC 50062 TaxID=461836 RepID=A0A0L0D1D4_THETB|nr:carnitine/acylcarnitine carrier protein [Thecamonas trahens ATCC 50062]KNC45940.1 carnitine/acylcarnitine carrier protein [Thecamonas trahens ATCC 50062]|eukprot:XP_013762923.1 carnitine/acylcarnitine carrier protein [Thecamonas trahens ATCC 50062]
MASECGLGSVPLSVVGHGVWWATRQRLSSSTVHGGKLECDGLDRGWQAGRRRQAASVREAAASSAGDDGGEKDPLTFGGVRLKAVLAGMFSGMAGTAMGQPMDMIKVRLQTQAHMYTGAMDALRTIVRQEGWLALYKGMLPPMVSMVVTCSISFGTYDAIKHFLLANFPHLTSPERPEWPAAKMYFLAGGLTALMLTPVTTPSELVKIRAQLDNVGKNRFSNSVQVLQHVVRKHGASALYTGYSVNALREIMFVSIYFGVYEVAKRNLQMRLAGSLDVDDAASPLLLRIAIPFAGGAAGAFAWTASFPLDVLKSDIQSSRLTPRPSFAAMTSMVRRRWVRLGWRGFYRGATTSIMRAFLVSSTRFSAYEFAVSVLTKVFAPHLHPDFDDDNILVASESDGHDHDVGRRMEKTP